MIIQYFHHICNYCLKRDLCHPGVVILDSPLTTYIEKDKKKERNI